MRSEAVYPVDHAGLIQTVNLQWHPRGHEPEHVYDIPHFDLHFYTITEQTRATIVPGAPAGTVMPPKSMLPPDGILAPGFVPGMGMHDVSSAQPEFNHGTFGISPILGFWNGDVAFFEVMFSKAWIDAKHDTSGTMPTPPMVATHGLYPTRYAVHYDKAADAYRVEISDFVQR